MHHLLIMLFIIIIMNNFDRVIPTTYAAVLDFCKAFDIVPDNNKLIQKLGCKVVFKS